MEKISLLPNPASLGNFDTDILKRSSFGQSLTNLIKKTNDPLVISLNGAWGEGKSTFVKMWQGMLDHNDIPNIYIDAFENDYVQDPFMVINSAISDYIEKHSPKDTKDELIRKAKTVMGRVAVLASKIAIQVATAGIIKELDVSELTKPIETLSEKATSAAEKYIEQRLSDHKKELESIASFKRFMSSIPSILNNKSENSLTIIIDEIDRCKPTFAVELLEKVKHFFSVPNITFVLVINRRQLEESIRTAYGQNIDSRAYLQKFISLEATLPKRIGWKDGDNQAYSQLLMEFYKIDGDHGGLHAYLPEIADHLGMTLRDIEKFFINLKLYQITNRELPNNYGIPTILLCFKISRPDIFDRLVRGKITYQQIFSEINYIPEPTSLDPLHNSMHMLKHSLMNDLEYENSITQAERDLYRGGYEVDGVRTASLSNFINAVTAFSIP